MGDKVGGKPWGTPVPNPSPKNQGGETKTPIGGGFKGGPQPAGATDSGGASSGGSAVATASGRIDRPTPTSRWYGAVTVIAAGVATVVLEDDSGGASVLQLPVESVAPVAGDRVICDFFEGGQAAVTAIVL